MHTAALKYIYFLLYYLLLLSFPTLSCQLHLSLFMITGDGGKEYLFEDKHFWKITKLNSWPSAGKRHCGNNSVRKKTQRINKIPQQGPRASLGMRIQVMGSFANLQFKKLIISDWLCSVSHSGKTSVYRSWRLDVCWTIFILVWRLLM